MNRRTKITKKDDVDISIALSNLKNSLIERSRKTLEVQFEEGQYTELEMKAMIYVEALRMTSSMDLATMIVRGQIVKDIERENAIRNHPKNFRSLAEMATIVGISPSELHDIKELCETILPYLEQNGFSPAQLWGTIGKSKMRDMVPVLVSIITKKKPKHSSALQAVNFLTEATKEEFASLEKEGIIDAQTSATDKEKEKQRLAVFLLMDKAQSMTTNELRVFLRPDSIQANSIVAYPDDLGTQDGYMLIKVKDKDRLDKMRRLIPSNESEVSDRANLKTIFTSLANLFGG